MSVSIMEALQNAEYNLQNGLMVLAREQLHNAVVLLEKGYDVSEVIEPLIEKYGDVTKVPDIGN